MRQNLVIIHTGRDQAYRRWFDPSLSRTWDLMLIYYDGRARADRDSRAEVTERGAATKFDDVHFFWCKDSDLFWKREAILVLDDDLCFPTHHHVDHLFRLAKGLNLCQPSLTRDSPAGWGHTRNVNPLVPVRPTNFVEIMCPLFSGEAFCDLVDTFNETVSGWGLDFLWGHLLRYERMAIIDGVQVRHMNPLGNPKSDTGVYGYLKKLGVDPVKECEELCQRYGIRPEVATPR